MRDRRYWLRLVAFFVLALAGALLFLPLAAGGLLMWGLTHVGCARSGSPDQFGLAYEDVRFTTPQGRSIDGYFLPGSNGGTVIVAPSLRSEEHTSELQSRENLVCRLLLDPPRPQTYPLSLHDALPISAGSGRAVDVGPDARWLCPFWQPGPVRTCLRGCAFYNATGAVDRWLFSARKQRRNRHCSALAEIGRAHV